MLGWKFRECLLPWESLHALPPCPLKPIKEHSGKVVNTLINLTSSSTSRKNTITGAHGAGCRHGKQISGLLQVMCSVNATVDSICAFQTIILSVQPGLSCSGMLQEFPLEHRLLTGYCNCLIQRLGWNKSPDMARITEHDAVDEDHPDQWVVMGRREVVDL